MVETVTNNVNRHRRRYHFGCVLHTAYIIVHQFLLDFSMGYQQSQKTAPINFCWISVAVINKSEDYLNECYEKEISGYTKLPSASFICPSAHSNSTQCHHA